MKELHEGPSREHFATKITQRKILNARYWWPTMYRNVHDYYRSCNACQRARALAIGNSKSCKAGHKSSKGTIYEMGI